MGIYFKLFFESLESFQLVRKEDVAKEGFPDVKGGMKKCHRRKQRDNLNSKSLQVKSQMAYYNYISFVNAKKETVNSVLVIYRDTNGKDVALT